MSPKKSRYIFNHYPARSVLCDYNINKHVTSWMSDITVNSKISQYILSTNEILLNRVNDNFKLSNFRFSLMYIFRVEMNR